MAQERHPQEDHLAPQGAVAEFGSLASKTFHSMKTIRILCLWFAVTAAAAAFAADPTGTWKWSTASPNSDIPTTHKLELKNGKIAGPYSNQYGDTAISNASLQDDVI